MVVAHDSSDEDYFVSAEMHSIFECVVATLAASTFLHCMYCNNLVVKMESVVVTLKGCVYICKKDDGKQCMLRLQKRSTE
jgi:hypothetical protein